MREFVARISRLEIKPVKLHAVFALLGLSLIGLTGCVTDEGTAAMAQASSRPRATPASDRAPWVLQTPFGIMYSQTPRETVQYSTREAPGTIIVDTPNRYLYYVSGRDQAIRYSIAVGGEGYDWAGTSTISNKREWPDWTPTPGELKRFPNLPKHMAGGEDNPLGARALYLGATLYRIHGTNEPWKLGTAVSSGCIRLSNDDIVDLYNRAKIGAKVIVRR
jgi:lipoprotein-anchoring transpeptidase ErfK/SrfK